MQHFRSVKAHSGAFPALFVPQIRTELEMNMTCNLREFKGFIDKEMIVILGQMDSPTEIFEHVFLVGVFHSSAIYSTFSSRHSELYEHKRGLVILNIV